MQNSMIEFILSTDCGMVEKIRFGEEHDRISAEAYKAYEKFKQGLNDAQKEEFDKFVDLQIQEQAEAEETFFKAGFKSGVRLAAECLTG